MVVLPNGSVLLMATVCCPGLRSLGTGAVQMCEDGSGLAGRWDPNRAWQREPSVNEVDGSVE